MTEPIEVIKSRVVVLVGSFNPPIFHPSWFSSAGILPKEQVDEAQDVIVTSEVTSWKIQPTFECVITRHRAQFTCDTGYESDLFDVISGAFEVLASTPIGMVGLNSTCHIGGLTQGAWHAIGHRLAPKDGLWDAVLQEPGLLSMRIQGVRPDGQSGMINVTVEPSGLVEHGLYIDVNDHRIVVSDESSASVDRGTPIEQLGPMLGAQSIGSSLALEYLDEHYFEAWDEADTIMGKIRSWVR